MTNLILLVKQNEQSCIYGLSEFVQDKTIETSSDTLPRVDILLCFEHNSCKSYVIYFESHPIFDGNVKKEDGADLAAGLKWKPGFFPSWLQALRDTTNEEILVPDFIMVHTSRERSPPI